MKNITLDYLLELVEGTRFHKIFRALLGYEDEVELFAGIDDSLEANVDELEEIAGFEIPGDFLHILLLTNGFRIFDFKLFPLTAKNSDKNGMYYINSKSDYKEKNSIPEEFLVIGEITEKFAVCITYDNEGYITYCLWDKEKKNISITYDYLIEIIASEIDYHNDAFSGE